VNATVAPSNETAGSMAAHEASSVEVDEQS
jgi:hypothetical protein